MRPSPAVLAAVILVVGACTTTAGPLQVDLATTTSPAAPTTTLVTTTRPDDPVGERRWDMVDLIENRGVTAPAVLTAMRAVPRHEFVPADLTGRAYGDHALPIGHGQTISQPYIVGAMSMLLEVAPGAKVLEIGTGSGYQAAVLAEMGVEVYSVEIIPELAVEGRDRFDRLGYDVTTLTGDGYFGWEEHAPFDAIVVTAAPDHVPQPLVNQLGSGGRMVIPIGPVGAVQTMWRFTVDETGELLGQNIGSVAFVPFTRTEE